MYVTLTVMSLWGTQTKTVTRDTETTFSFPLTQETGSITVTGTLAGEIFINGTDTGFTTTIMK